MKAFIFDLDGVIVDTAKYHFKSWEIIGKQLGFELSKTQNELLKGISREESLEKILNWGGISIDRMEKKKYLGKKNGVPQIKDLWTRLWRETELSIDIAESIKKSLNVIPEIDLDYNENENFKSNKLVNASKGLANSLGYKVNIKPHIQIATRAADYHCK